MQVKELTVEQFKALIEDTIESTLQEYLGDPDEGLELKDEVIRRLKLHRASRRTRTPMEQVAKRHGLELK